MKCTHNTLFHNPEKLPSELVLKFRSSGVTSWPSRIVGQYMCGLLARYVGERTALCHNSWSASWNLPWGTCHVGTCHWSLRRLPTSMLFTSWKVSYQTTCTSLSRYSSIKVPMPVYSKNLVSFMLSHYDTLPSSCFQICAQLKSSNWLK